MLQHFLNIFKTYFRFQDADSCEQHCDSARGDDDDNNEYHDDNDDGGVAAGLHAPRVPLPGGVRRHPPEDRHTQEVSLSTKGVYSFGC